MNIKKIIWFLFLMINFSFINAWAHFTSFHNIIVFGDSLSDIGNNTWIHASGAPITNFDRQGNKYLWIDYLSKTLFKSITYSSNQLSEVSPLTHNVSYAYASADTNNIYLNADWPGATTHPSVNLECSKPGLLKNVNGDVMSTCVPGLLKQIDLYLNDVNKQPNKSTLFFIWAGANDLFYQLPTGQPPAEILKNVIGNIVMAKNKLLDHGVLPQQIYVINLPDLSKTPFAIKYSLNLTAISVAFNTKLEKDLTAQNQQHLGIDNSHIISIYNVMNNILQNPAKFSLKNVTQSCVENLQAPLCENYMFYDLKHVTAAMNKIIADDIIKNLH